MVTATYAACLGVLMVISGLAVSMKRVKFDTSIGDGGHPELLASMRRFGNFVEYVPYALLLIFMLEHTGAKPYYIHALGGCLLSSRLFHLVGLVKESHPPAWRTLFRAMGVFPTHFVILATASALMWQSLNS